MQSEIEKEIKRKERIIKAFHSPFTAWVILICGLCVTGAAWHVSSNAVQSRAEERFSHRVEELERAIYDRMIVYEQALRGVVALFDSTDFNVDRDTFRRYVDTLDIEKNWPGIQGIGFSIPVKPSNKEVVIDKVRAEGFKNFTIKPEGERDLYSTIIYLEPFDWRNQRAFGYDMWSNDMRRAAMKRARDEGLPSTSGIITLVQETEENVQKGFLTYLPVYKSNSPTETLEQRRAAFIGWVYSPFRMGDLMQGILGSKRGNIDYEIFDGQKPTNENMLFDSNEVTLFQDQGYTPDFVKTSEINLQGRTWKILFQSKPNYISGAESLQPTVILVIGLIVDFLLFYVITALVFLRNRANNLASDMTSELKVAKGELEDKLALVESKNRELEQFADLTYDREERVLELKREVNDLHKELGKDPPYDISFMEKVKTSSIPAKEV